MVKCSWCELEWGPMHKCPDAQAQDELGRLRARVAELEAALQVQGAGNSDHRLLRDLAANAALTGLLSGRSLPNDRHDWQARLGAQAYGIADAMMAARVGAPVEPREAQRLIMELSTQVKGLRSNLEEFRTMVALLVGVGPGGMIPETARSVMGGIVEVGPIWRRSCRRYGGLPLNWWGIDARYEEAERADERASGEDRGEDPGDEEPR